MSRELKRLSEVGDDAAWFGLHREQWDPIVVARFTIEGEPMSKARARHTKTGQTYSPAANREAEKKIAWLFRQASGVATADAECSYGVVALFFASTRQRRDVDNMLKLILDGLNKVAWADDTQVSEISGRKELIDEPEHARTEVAVYRLGPVPTRAAKCEHCGTTYTVYRSQRGRRFCSRTCDEARRALARQRACTHCGDTFDAKSSAKYCSLTCNRAAKSVTMQCVQCGGDFIRARSLAPKQMPTCSPECRATYWRITRAKNAKGTCSDCGGTTSKKAYTRCQACSLTVVEVT